MEDTINTIEDLKAAAAHAFQVVKPCKHGKGRAHVSISINSYAELSWFMIDALKVCVAALDAENEDVTNVRNVAGAVSGILEKLVGIVPLEEMDLLDKVREMMPDTSHATVTANP